MGSKGCAAGYAVFIEDSMGRVLMKIPCAEVWLLPDEEDEMGYQPNVFFFAASRIRLLCNLSAGL